MYALRMSVVNKEATYLLTYLQMLTRSRARPRPQRKWPRWPVWNWIRRRPAWSQIPVVRGIGAPLDRWLRNRDMHHIPTFQHRCRKTPPRYMSH